MPSYYKFTIYFIALALMGLGGTVLYGWYSHKVVLLQIYPSFAPMQFNAALGFMVIGACMFGLAWGARYAVLSCAAILVLMGGLTLSQYIAQVNLGIDQLFMKHYLTTASSSPGRMAPNSALSFTLFGLFALITQVERFKLMNLVLGVMATIIIGLGAVAGSGYLSGIETAYGWGNLTRMALHTSVGFVVAGIGALLWVIYHERDQVAHWFPYSTGIGLAVVAIVLWQALSAWEIRQDRIRIENMSFRAEIRVVNAFNNLSQVLQRMAERYALNIYSSHAAWRFDADMLVRDIEGLEHVAIYEHKRALQWNRVPGFSLGSTKWDQQETAIDYDNYAIGLTPLSTGSEYKWYVLSLWLKNDTRTGVVAVVDADKLIRGVLPKEMLTDIGAIELGNRIVFGNRVSASMLVSPLTMDLVGHPLHVYFSEQSMSHDNHGFSNAVLGFGLALAVLITLLLVARQRMVSQNEVLKQTGIERDLALAVAKDNTLRLQTVFDTAPVGLVTCNAQGVISSVNDLLASMFGYSRSELIGQPIETLVPESKRLAHREYRGGYASNALMRAMGPGRDIHGLHRDGHLIPIEVRLSPMVLPTGNFVLASVLDITNRKSVEKKLADQSKEIMQYNDELVQANVELTRSNQDLDDFAYIASHDLKEPLRGISNYALFLYEDYGEQLDEEGKQKLLTLQKLSQRMAQLVDTLLHYSRVGRVDLAVRETHMDALLDDVLESLDDWIREQGAQVRRPQPLPLCECDHVRVQEVFRNLITNAIKYNERPDKWVEVGASDTIPPTFYVRDNGIGIDPKHHQRIFKMFKRLHARDAYGGGTGAGLAFVKKIVERHGGQIWLESSAETGTTFYFTLSPRQHA